MQIETSSPPQNSLIAPFFEAEGHYADAFCVRVDGAVELPAFIEAFYSTWLFRLERLVLRFLARSPSTLRDVQALAQRETTEFAIWQVEERRSDEILLPDRSGRTKSWLHTQPNGGGTTLWFGTVVVPVERRGKPTLGPVFQTLQGAHLIYARMLLRIAAQAASTEC